ncbi:MAG: GMC family oxidoreductase [Bdellovibrionales bacterium]|nr:GMC family oxidoreductase [Bdellovibrionales bacterium]
MIQRTLRAAYNRLTLAEAAQQSFDVIIIGSGAGGGTLARLLAGSKLKILLLERGDFIPQHSDNHDPVINYSSYKYRHTELAVDGYTGKSIPIKNSFCVGGRTKFYGASLLRFREIDFEEIQFPDGISPAWPISYRELEPYYCRAEHLYGVHGCDTKDPTAPFRGQPYPFPELPWDPYIAQVTAALEKQNLSPAPIPIAIDYRSGGRCVFCNACDGYPCMRLAKMDSEVCGVLPALDDPNVSLLTNAVALRILTNTDGDKAEAVEISSGESEATLYAKHIAVCCGAIESALLFLRSATAKHPRGLANSSGLVGRNLMLHNFSILIPISPSRRNTSRFQKHFLLHDYYQSDSSRKYPLGTVQLVGRLPIHAQLPQWSKQLGLWLEDHSIQLFVMSEDLPNAANRVECSDEGTKRIFYRPNNLEPHRALVKKTVAHFRKADFPFVVRKLAAFWETLGAHDCGTLRFGNHPAHSVLNPLNQTWDIDNLYVVDASFFPTSAAVNPVLTLLAQTIRVADHLASKLALSHPEPTTGFCPHTQVNQA